MFDLSKTNYSEVYTGIFVISFLGGLGVLVQLFTFHNMESYPPFLILLCFGFRYVYRIVKKQKTAAKIKSRKILFGLIILSIIVGAIIDNIFISLFLGFLGQWPVSIFYSDENNAVKQNE